MIQIIDGFKVNASVPIDNRFVVENDTERDNITNKYHGLRVWVKSTNIPYYWDGSTWKEELGGYVKVSPPGINNTIPKFTGTGTIGNSQITDNGTTVNIPNNLIVGGSITFNSLVGNINNITGGNLNITRLQPGSNGQILRTIGSDVQWVNVNTLTIGTSDNSNKIKIQGINNNTEYRLVLKKGSENIGSGGSYLDMYSYSSGLLLKDDGGNGLRILAHNGSVSSPPYSFNDSPNTGMYRPSPDVIGFSIATNLIGFFESDGLRVRDKNGSTTGYMNVSYMGVPIGGIIMWSGNINDIGTGHLWNFRLCNGSTIPSSLSNPDGGTNLTPKYAGQSIPDLRERFVVGAGGENGDVYIGTGYDMGETGGVNDVVLQGNQIGEHTHYFTTDSDGAHKHTIKTSLDAGGVNYDGPMRTNGGQFSQDIGNKISYFTGGDNPTTGANEANHTHSGTTNWNQEQVDVESHENRPPYYALAFIIRIV